MEDIHPFLETSSRRHSHLCPRQVLGVRTALLACRILGLEYPRTDKRLLVISETDGCYVDGMCAVAGVSVGKRTLRIVDYGKIAAAFADTQTGRAIRLTPRLDVRDRAGNCATEETSRYAAQLKGYQSLPDVDLMVVQDIQLDPSLETLISKPGARVQCIRCGEDIINEREIWVNGEPFCRSCAGQAYYRPGQLLDLANSG